MIKRWSNITTAIVTVVVFLLFFGACSNSRSDDQYDHHNRHNNEINYAEENNYNVAQDPLEILNDLVSELNIQNFDQISIEQREFELPPSTGQIFLYGESHQSPPTLEKVLERWGYYYTNHGTRHFFKEMSYFGGELLNLWMQAANDEILYAVLNSWYDTSVDVPYMLPFYKTFYKTIKNDFPETIFHGVDVGNRWQTVGIAFLDLLKKNGLEDSEMYQLTLENIEQSNHYANARSHSVRAVYKPLNFIREFDRLVDQDVMAVHGWQHVLDDLFLVYNMPTMAASLRLRYGDNVHTFDIRPYGLLPHEQSTINIDGYVFTASYFGMRRVSTFQTHRALNVPVREFWRIEDPDDALANSIIMHDSIFLPVINQLSFFEAGDIFMIDTHYEDEVVRRFYKMRRSNHVLIGEQIETIAFGEPINQDNTRIITVDGTDFNATSYGFRELHHTARHTPITTDWPFALEYFRLEDSAFEMFSSSLLSGDFVYYADFPMRLELNQILVIDIHYICGEIERRFYRTSGIRHNGLAVASRFDPYMQIVP